MNRRLWGQVWAKRNFVERSLIVALGGLLLCLGLTFTAWMRDIRPLAPVWGTWADWVAAGGTILGFGAAVLTLRWNALDEKKRRRNAQRAEAARVALTWDEEPKALADDAGNLWLHKGTFHNSGSSPIRDVYITMGTVQGGVTDFVDPDWVTAEKWQFEALAPGMTRDIDILMRWTRKRTPTNAAVHEAMVFCFVDVEDELWMNDETGLRPIGSTTKYRQWWIDRRHSFTPEPLPHVWEQS